ncbi:MAG: PQQ-dependent sugar dehydrogenase [Gemmatimonadaceae bacterium]
MRPALRRTAPFAALALALLAGAAPLGAQPAPAERTPAVPDPIPERPVMSRVGLVLRRAATFPRSVPVPAPEDARLVRHARINHLGEIADGSGRRFVPDLNGSLYVLRGGTPAVYLDVKRAVGASFFSGRGMGSGFGFVAFHPDFARNGKLYTVHTEAFEALRSRTPDFAPPGNAVVHGVVTEWTASDPRAATFRGTHREVLRLGFVGFIHGIQQIDFDPTARPGDEGYGLLYVAVGDGGTGAVTRAPQDLGAPYGKLLRIDPAGTNAASGRYGIPRSNPFVGRRGALGEVWAYGMRDPHRFSWDSGPRQRMLLAHIGERQVEGIYDVRAGDNLGWSEREGPLAFDRDDPCALHALPSDDARHGYVYPVAAYDHERPPWHPCGLDVGHAVAGGFVYRGSALPALRGKYVFADLVDGRVMYVEEREMRRGGPRATIHELPVFDEAGRETTMPLLAGSARVDLRVGRDAAGELYLLSKANGTVWKVVGTRRVGPTSTVFPSLAPSVVAHYDFEHADPRDAAAELDMGSGKTPLRLLNGGARMRVRDGAHPASRTSIQLRQVNPGQAGGNDDWKAGVWDERGVSGLHAFNGVTGATVMGWFKATGPMPAPRAGSPDGRYDAAGLAGILSGDSDGHAVRALLELITVRDTLRLVALGRRVDGGASQTFAASAPWDSLLPRGEWVLLAATFDFAAGRMALYRNGRPLDGAYLADGDPWGVREPGPHAASRTDPRGVKVGGSFPQNTRERNPCDCRTDDLLFLDRALSPLEVDQQYRRMIARR